MKNILILFIVGVITSGYFTSCSKVENETDINYNFDQNIGLKEISKYPIGMAVKPSLIQGNSLYCSILNKDANRITPENSMKMKYLSLDKDKYYWDEADYLVEYAIDNGLQIHGHTLIWDNSVPDWMKNYETDAEGWKQIMKDYIFTVVGRWKGKIKSWDVVNEAIDDSGNIKQGFWYSKVGSNYIDWAFQYAHDADPDALLFYNDYGHEYSTTRLKAINKMLSEMKERGIPVHGTGLQMHTSLRRDKNELRNAVIESAKIGLLVHVSELDVCVNINKDKELKYSNSIISAQMDKFYEVAKAMKDIPLEQSYGITTWGVGDNDSFMSSYDYPEWPLLFDSQYNQKAVYESFWKGCNKNF